MFECIDKIKESGLLIIWISGELSYEAILPLLTKIEEIEKQYPAGFKRFTDLSKVDSMPLSSEQIKTITERRIAVYKGPSVRSAFLADEMLHFGLVRIYTAMMEPYSPVDVDVFYELKKCADWLGIDQEKISNGLKI